MLTKKACSPAEKLNSSAQSRQVRLRSWYTLSRPSSARTHDGEDRDTEGATGRRRARVEGVRTRSARARSPELIAVKIRAPSSPVGTFLGLMRRVGLPSSVRKRGSATGTVAAKADGEPRISVMGDRGEGGSQPRIGDRNGRGIGGRRTENQRRGRPRRRRRRACARAHLKVRERTRAADNARIVRPRRCLVTASYPTSA